MYRLRLIRFKAVLVFVIIIFISQFLNFGISLALIMILKVLLFIYFIYLIAREVNSTFLKHTNSILFGFLLLEIVFTFIPKSNGFGLALSNRVWYLYNYNYNNNGFRELKNSKNSKIYFFGDSFAEGAGVKYSQRFSSLINKRRTSYNFSKSGFSTKEELNLIKNNDFFKKKIFVQYFPNDIEGIALKNKLFKNTYTNPYDRLPFISRLVIKSSFLLDFMYWLIPKENDDSYTLNLIKAYEDGPTFNEHLDDIIKIKNISENKNSKLCFIIIPYLAKTNLNKVFRNKLIEKLKENNIDYIDVFPLISNLNIEEQIVNNTDGHASPLVHKIIAKEIDKKLLEYEL